MRRLPIEDQPLLGHEFEMDEKAQLSIDAYEGHSSGYRLSVYVSTLQQSLVQALDRIDALEVRVRAAEAKAQGNSTLYYAHSLGVQRDEWRP